MKNDNDVVKCKWCVIKLGTKYIDMKVHVLSKKHIGSKPSTSLEQPVEEVEQSPKVKIAEATTALFIAEHCSILTVDHLSKLYPVLFSDSAIADKFKI